MRAAPRRAAQGHDTAAGCCGPRRPLRAAPRRSAPLRRPPRRDQGGEFGGDGAGGRCVWGVAVSSRRLSPGGQRKPLAERSPSPSQCAHLAERRRERGRELLHFWGRYQPPRPSPAFPPQPPRPTHARRAPPAAPQRRKPPHTPPTTPPLRLRSPCAARPAPHPAPHPRRRPPASSPFPTAKQKSPTEGADKRLFQRCLTEFSSPLLFVFSAPPPPHKKKKDRAVPSEAGDSSGDSPGSVSCHSCGAQRGVWKSPHREGGFRGSVTTRVICAPPNRRETGSRSRPGLAAGRQRLCPTEPLRSRPAAAGYPHPAGMLSCRFLLLVPTI